MVCVKPLIISSLFLSPRKLGILFLSVYFAIKNKYGLSKKKKLSPQKPETRKQRQCHPLMSEKDVHFGDLKIKHKAEGFFLCEEVLIVAGRVHMKCQFSHTVQQAHKQQLIQLLSNVRIHQLLVQANKELSIPWQSVLTPSSQTTPSRDKRRQICLLSSALMTPRCLQWNLSSYGWFCSTYRTDRECQTLFIISTGIFLRDMESVLSTYVVFCWQFVCFHRETNCSKWRLKESSNVTPAPFAAHYMGGLSLVACFISFG